MKLRFIKRTLIAAPLLIFCFNSMSAQSFDVKTGSNDDDKVKITLGGRIYLDGAVYFDDKTPIGNGASIPDTRLSMKASYKKWDFKIDMGFNDKKVNPKDLHIRYNFNKHSWIRFGHFGPQFGNEGWETSAWQRFVAPAPANQLFSLPRLIGTTYMNWNEKFYFSAGGFMDNDAISNTKEGNQGFVLISKTNYTPFNDKKGSMFHVGASGYYRTGNRIGFNEDKKTDYGLSMTSNLNTKVTKLKGVGINLDNIDFQATYVLELLASTGPAFLQWEYYHTNVKRRHGLDSYQADGFYVMGGIMLFGEKTYKYDLSERKLGHAASKTLELVARYDYADLNDHHGQGLLRGGRISDISVGFNYYLNKYTCFKLDYSHMSLGKGNALSATGQKEKVQVIQGRFMVIF